MKKSQKSKVKGKNFQGFTLIELLVVIVIIGVLASFLMANYIGIKLRSRDAQRKSDLRQIQSALELYRSDEGEYPAALPACNTALVSGGVTYMQKVPCDPTNTAPLTYRYQSAAPNLTYTLSACLENGNDQQKDSSNVAPCNGTSSWSYTLYSP